jgi:hypothetical protein
MTPIELLLSGVGWKCLACGSSAGCDCWEKCSCGWTAEKGQMCRNPDTIRCSTKLKYGTWNRKTRRYEASAIEKQPTKDVS